MKLTAALPNEIFGLEKDLLKIFLLPFVLIVVGLVVFFNVVLPRISAIGITNSAIVDVDQKTKKINEKSNYLISMDQNELKKNADYLSAAIIHQKNAYYLVNVVRFIAEKYGYQIDSFSVAPGKVSGDDSTGKSDALQAQTLPVSLNIIGPSNQYIDLMIAFEKSLPILSISKLEMKTTAETTEVDLVMSAYYVGDSVAINLANLSLADLTLDKEESAVIQKISSFERGISIEDVVKENASGQQFVKYDRSSPFNF
jgi:hypothetical protein